MKKPKVCVLRAAGTNCDKETAFAFLKVGASTELTHINSLIKKEALLEEFHILAIPGGFTYGDDAGAGKILANELKSKLIEDLKRFIAAGKLIIGICNGFQVLVKSGLLPGNSGFIQDASLIINDSGKFEDRWVFLKTPRQSFASLRAPFGRQDAQTQVSCVWAKDLPEVIYLPVAHGEGKFVTGDKQILERLKKKNQIVFQYCDEKANRKGYPYNPNGSLEDIAGICDETGRILGLMPHPERHIDFYQHPGWTHIRGKSKGDGLQIFRNGVEYAKKQL